MTDVLTHEICKRIIADVGAVPGDDFGTRGLVDDGFLLQKTIDIQYDNGQKLKHDVYSGKLSLGDSELRSILVNLSVEGDFEFLFVFRFDSMPIHAARIVYDDINSSFIRIFNEANDKWIVPSVYMKARLLADFERFVSWGLLWDKCTEVSDLYNVALKVI